MLLAALLGVCWSFGVQLAAADDGGAPAAQPEGPADDVEDGDVGDLQLRYAMARLKLAELDLQRAVKLNRPAPNAIGGLEIKIGRAHV